MRKLKLLIAVAALTMGVGTASAREDVTATYLTNGNLSALTGWTIDATQPGHDTWPGYTDHKTNGAVNVLEFYSAWSGNAAGTSIGNTRTFDFSQTATLPQGYYRLKVNGFYREGNNNPTTNQKKAYIYAGAKQQYLEGFTGFYNHNSGADIAKAAACFGAGYYENEFDFDMDAEGQIQIGFHGYIDTYCSWCIIGPVTLYKYEMSDFAADFNTKKAQAEALYNSPMNATVLATLKEKANVDQTAWTTKDQITTAESELNAAISAANASIAYYESLKKVIDDNAAIVATYDATGQSTYATESASAIAAYNNGTATDCNTEIAALKAALVTACKAQVQPTDGCDMTVYIVNPGIDGNANGWTTNMNGNGGYAGGPMKPSNDAMEFWAAGTLTDQDKGKTFDYYQTISNLPNGIYTIGADLLNSTNGEDGANWNGGGKAGVYGKTGSSEVIKLVTTDGETFLPYTTDGIVVYDGTLTIGVKNIAALTGRWFACDNFKLTYVRQLEEGDKTTFTASFVNGEGWEKVYAYAWNTDTDVKTAAWPGDEIAKSGTKNYNGTPYDVYTYSITDYGMPKNIIFNQGDDQKKTADLTFVDGMVNDDKVTKIAVYAVVGSNQAETDKAFFSGNWDAANTTDLMTESEGKWTISFPNVTLTDPIIFKVIKKAYLEATEVEAWYPSGDNVLISETGDFNITITFDGTNVSYTCEPTTETFTVTDAGWATAKTAHAVDFTNTTGLTAYIATLSGETVTLTETAKIPANTPIVLKGVTAKADIIENGQAPEVTENALTWYDEYEVNDSYAHIYALTKGADGKAKFARVADKVKFYNKAVIELKGATARESFDVVFADETTGINAIAAEQNVEGIYNMNGQRVAAPAKGLYIVNGKKVILK